MVKHRKTSTSQYITSPLFPDAEEGIPYKRKRGIDLPKTQENRELITQGLKRCYSCKEVKPLADFRAQPISQDLCIGGVYNQCRECHYQFHRWRQMHRNYGIAREEYIALFTAQGFSCAICGMRGISLDVIGRSRSGKRGPSGVLTVDHDHKTGKVRGLLCEKCNQGIGMFKDDPAILEKAIQYLLRYASDSEAASSY